MLHSVDIESLPPVRFLSRDDRREVAVRSKVIAAQQGAVLYDVGHPCQHFLVVVQGAVCVRQTTAAGKPIVLYRLMAAEACALTTMALLAGTDSQHVATATADTDCQVLAIPAELFHRAILGCPAFLQFALAACAKRFDDLLRRIDNLTQHRIDARLAEILLAHCVADRPLRTSHELLAAEVGTAREVISRHLALFERQGAIERRRGSIAVRDRNTLEALVRRRT